MVLLGCGGGANNFVKLFKLLSSFDCTLAVLVAFTNKLLKFQLDSFREKDQKRIVPIVKKATSMPIKSSNPKSSSEDD